MYNSQEIATRIKQQIKLRDCTMGKMLNDLDLAVNTISQMSKGKDMMSKSLAKIADYLNCSVDYLLGRECVIVDRANVAINSHNKSGGDININSTTERLTDEEKEGLRVLRGLSVKDRIGLMAKIYEYDKQI